MQNFINDDLLRISVMSPKRPLCFPEKPSIENESVIVN